MRYKKGQSGNLNGRPTGATNKTTKCVREALLEALNDGQGAVAYFLKLKDSTKAGDRATFANLVGKLIPHEIVGKDGSQLLDVPTSSLEGAKRMLFLLAGAEIEHCDKNGGDNG